MGAVVANVFQLPAIAIHAAPLIGQVLGVKQLGHEADCSAHVMCWAHCSTPSPPPKLYYLD